MSFFTLPYLTLPSIPIYGSYAIQPFGALVVTGILAGYFWSKSYSKELGISFDEIKNCIYWVLIPAFIMCHVYDVILYQPERLMREGPILLLKINDGWSSTGGIFGAMIGFSIFLRKAQHPKILYTDIILTGFFIGWIFGRMGCSVAHDHPGALTDFFLAFDYPGGARHDLGFYEMLFTLFVLFPTILILRKKKLYGMSPIFLTPMYAVARFSFDFLRATDRVGADKRYLGLTPAQYAVVIFCVIAVVWYSKIYKKEVAQVRQKYNLN